MSHDARVGYLEVVEESFRSALRKSPDLAASALEVVRTTADVGAVEFAARILRNQVWAHGLFVRKGQADFDKIGEPADWEEACREYAGRWRDEHLATDWFFGNWKESPVWFLANVGSWDNTCAERLDQLTEDEAAFDAFIMMVFGRHYNVERSGVETLMGWENFLRKFRRLEDRRGERELSKDVQDAVEKAREAVIGRNGGKADGEHAKAGSE